MYRIFLGYRNGSDGYKFVEEIYNRIHETKNYVNCYGEVYFSPETEKRGNFHHLDFLKDIEWFVIPYSKDFFDYSGNERPIIFNEIEAALDNEYTRFLAVFFPDFEDIYRLKEKYKEVLNPKYCEDKILNRVTGAKFNSSENIDIIMEMLRIPKSMSDIYQQSEKNIYLSIKAESERIPLYQRLYGVKKLTFLNFAGTSFIAGADVAESYRDNELENWFKKEVVNGNIQCSIILTRPQSEADKDASRYKMFPREIRKELKEQFTLPEEHYDTSDLKHFIIRYNFNKITQFMLRNPNAKINLYYTDIVLPYGLLKSEFCEKMKKNDNIKVDIYAPNILVDDYRPSFVVMKENSLTSNMYNLFDESLTKFTEGNSPQAIQFSGHPDISFLMDKRIIHRGKMNVSDEPLSRNAILNCAKKGYPTEIDLLYTEDDILVWRDSTCEDYEGYGSDVWISDLNHAELNEIRRIKQKRENTTDYSIMTLQEMVDLLINVQMTIPLLIEIKQEWGMKIEDIRRNVIRTCRIMDKYPGLYAFHAANPIVVQVVKDYNVWIPCGQITLNFENNSDAESIPEEYCKLHTNAEYYEYVIPDFLSVREGDFVGEEHIYNIKRKTYNLKQIAWTIQDRRHERRCRHKYDNLIIEYDPEQC